MNGRNHELETGCQMTLIALVAVVFFAGIPAAVRYVTDAMAHSRMNAIPMTFACRSCGEVEDVHQVVLDAAQYQFSTVAGEGFAMFLGLLTGKLGTEPATISEVSVRLQDGSLRVFHESASSGWQTGDRVKVTTGRIKPLS